MAEDSTRRLLKLFGVAVTECEDALTRLRAAAGERAGADPGALADAYAAYARASRDLAGRWAEVGRLISEYHAGAEQALEAHLGSRRGA